MTDTTNKTNMTDPTDKKDFLGVDDPIPGQSYVCISFVSPEKLIQDFKGFQMCKFLQSYCKDQDLKYDELYSKFEDYIYKHSEDLERDFDDKNQYKTSMRGIKVRGTYGSKEEAEDRAKSISRNDSSFNVFVGQVGYWLPWDPCADNVDKEVFQDEQLNKLMEGYEQNTVNREIFYEEVKRDKIQKAKDEYMAAKEKKQAEAEKSSDLEIVEVNDNITIEDPLPEESVDYSLNSDIGSSMENVDPWMAKKLDQREETNTTDENK